MDIAKGSVYWVDLSPHFGTEPGKLRPAVVIQTNLLNEAHHPSTLVCPLTATVFPKIRWLRVHLERNEAGLAKESDILVDQIRAIDNRRFKKRLGILRKSSQLRLLESLKVILDL